MSPESILWIGAGVGLGLLVGTRYARAKRAYADYKTAQGAVTKAQQNMRAAVKFVLIAAVFIGVFLVATAARMSGGHP